MKYLAEVEAVQWKDTDESWDEVVELYQGVETVAFRTDDGGLSVETEDGREQVPIGYWVVKNGMGVISLVAPGHSAAGGRCSRAVALPSCGPTARKLKAVSV